MSTPLPDPEVKKKQPYEVGPIPENATALEAGPIASSIVAEFVGNGTPQNRIFLPETGGLFVKGHKAKVEDARPNVVNIYHSTEPGSEPKSMVSLSEGVFWDGNFSEELRLSLNHVAEHMKNTRKK